MPSPPPPIHRVAPVDAASLVILRGRGRGVEVLMGRRRPRAAFLPDIYVFPGGRVDRGDAVAPPGLRLRPGVEAKLTQRCLASRATALALAAIRETYEETGLLIGAAPARGTDRRLPATPMWRAFAAAGAVPALDALDYIARAITPAGSPRRFNTRFFIVDGDGDGADGELLRDGELLDLHWVRLDDATRLLNVVDVTEFVLREAEAHRSSSAADRARRPVPLLRYVNDRGRIIHE